MRFLIRLIVVVLVAIAIAIVGLLMLPGERIASIAADQLSKQTGREVSISSDTSISLYPTLGVTTGPASIASADWAKNGPLLTSDSLAIGVDVPALIGGTIRIKKLEAKSPRIVLERAADGRTNWDLLPKGDAAAEPVATETSDGQSFDLSLEQALITDASLRYIDHETGTDQNLKDVDIDLRWPVLNGPADLALGLTPFEDRVELDTTVADVMALLGGEQTTLSGSLNAAGADLTFEGIASIKPEAALQLNGNIPQLGALMRALGQEPSTFGLASNFNPRAKVNSQVSFDGTRLALRKMAVELDNSTASGDVDIVLNTAAPQITAKLNADVKNAGQLMQMLGQAPENFALSRDFDPSIKTAVNLSINGDAISANLSNLSASLAGANMSGALDIALSGGAPNVSGNISANVPSSANLMRALGQSAPDLPKGFGQAITASTGLSFKSNQLDLTGLNVSLDQNTLSGGVSLNLAGGTPNINATLQAGDLDLSALSPDESTSSESSAGSGWSKDPIDASALSALNGNIKLTARSINLGKLKLGAADLGVAIDRARAVVSINDLSAYQGRFGGQVVANNRNGLSVGGDLRANSVALGPLLSALADIDKISGNGNLNLKFLGVGNSVDAIMRSLSGDIAMSVPSGTVAGVDLESLIRQGDANARTTSFENLQASGVFTNGNLRNDDLSAKTGRVDARGEGNINLGAQTIDYLLTPVVNDVGEQDRIEIPVRIKGPWANVTVRPDLQAALNLENERKKLEEQARQEIEREKQKLLDQAEAEKEKLRAKAQAEAQKLEDRAKAKIEDAARKAAERAAEKLKLDQAAQQRLQDATKGALEREIGNGLRNLLGGN